jgi:hypothetical protein
LLEQQGAYLHKVAVVLLVSICSVHLAPRRSRSTSGGAKHLPEGSDIPLTVALLNIVPLENLVGDKPTNRKAILGIFPTNDSHKWYNMYNS